MSGSEEKALPPTARKLREARRRGEIPRSKEWVTAVVTAVGMVTLMVLMPHTIGQLRATLDMMGEFQQLPPWQAATQLTDLLGKICFFLVVPLIGTLASGAVVAGIIAGGGLNFSTLPLAPKLDRLDPIEGLRRMFKLRGLLELVKTAIKLVIVLCVALAVLRGEVGAWLELPACGLACVPRMIWLSLGPLLLVSAVVFLVIGLLDIALQRWLFHRDMRMSRTEHKRDRKEAEGDPQRIGQRRRERLEEAKVGARTGLRHATFVVRSRDTALAFRYHPPDTMVPTLVARARGDALPRFAAEVRQRRLPLIIDEKAVERLSQGLEVGKMIRRPDFATVISWMKTARVFG